MLNRSNVAIVAKFRLKASPYSQLVVATTHLLYNHRRQDVRLAQVQVLLAEIDRIAYRGIDEHRRVNYLPIILTGDFNFQPNTAPYGKMMSLGRSFASVWTQRLVSALIVNGCLTNNSLGKRLEITNQIYEPKFGNVLLPIELGVTDDCQHFDRTTPMVSHMNICSTQICCSLKILCLQSCTALRSHQINESSYLLKKCMSLISHSRPECWTINWTFVLCMTTRLVLQRTKTNGYWWITYFIAKN